MSVWTMPSGAMVQTHESFTHPFAGSGVEVHGTEGSIFGRGIMTQKPVGEVELVDAAGRHAIGFERARPLRPLARALRRGGGGARPARRRTGSTG